MGEEQDWLNLAALHGWLDSRTSQGEVDMQDGQGLHGWLDSRASGRRQEQDWLNSKRLAGLADWLKSRTSLGGRGRARLAEEQEISKSC